jgi:hypothetical protein
MESGHGDELLQQRKEQLHFSRKRNYSDERGKKRRVSPHQSF